MTLQKVVEFDRNQLGLHPVPVPLSAATTLTSAHFGKWILLGGAASYTLTLPAASASTNKVIGFRAPPDLAIATVVTVNSPGAETATFYLIRGMVLVIASNGTRWEVVYNWWPADTGHFRAIRNPSTALGVGDQGVVNNSLQSDPMGWYNATLGLYIPKLPGWYELEAAMLILQGATLGAIFLSMTVNAVTVQGLGRDNVAANNYIAFHGRHRVLMDGTQNARPLVNCTAGGTHAATGAESYFSGRYIGPSITA